MAENRVQITIVADGRNAEQAVRSLNSQLSGLDGQTRQTGSGMRDLSGQVDRAGSSMLNLGAIAKGVMGYFTVGAIKSHVQEVTMLAARYDTLGVVMGVVGNNAGYTRAEMDQFDAGLRQTGISALESRNNLAKMASANIDLAKSTELARIAQDAAVIGNVNSSEAFQRMIYGIQSAQVEVLRTIGLNVNFENSYKALADQLGTTSAELTEAEKTQARLSAVLEQAPTIAGTYEASLDTVGKKLGSTTRLAEDAQVKLGAVFQPALILLVDAYTDALTGVNETLSDTSIIEHWADVVKSEVLDIMQIAVSMNMVLARAGQAASAVGMALYGPGAALGIENSVRGFEHFAQANLDYQEQYLASERELNRLVSEQEQLFRKKTDTEQESRQEAERRRIAAGQAARDQAEADAQALQQTQKLQQAREKAAKQFEAEQKKQQAAHQKAREAMARNEQQTLAAMDKYMDDYEARQIKAIADRAAETRKLREKALEEEQALREKAHQEQEEAAQRTMDRIQDATADVFYTMFKNAGDGWQNLWSSMKDWALRTIAELAAKAATMHIVVPILTTITGAGTANAAVNALSGGSGGFDLSNLSSLVQPGSLLSEVPGFGAVSSLLATQLPGTATALTGAFSGVGSGAGMYAATGLGFSSSAVANGAMQGLSLGGQPLAATAPAMTTGMTIGSALGYGALGGMGYSLLGGAVGLPQNQWSGLTASLGGTLGAWGGSALAAATGATLGATAGSVVPIIGTAVGAVLGGLAASMLGGKEQSPSVIFQKQDMAWGQTDAYQFHTKDGAKTSQGAQIAAALGQVAGTVYEQVDALLTSLGSGYVDQLQDATVTWGRKSGGLWNEWDFGADHNFEELFAKASEDLKQRIYDAAAPVFSQAGSDYLGSSAVSDAYALLSDGATQFAAITEVIRQGVQNGDLETYATQLKSFQAAIAAVTQTWEAVSQASAELVTPLTQYEQAQRSINVQYDTWIAQLTALGFAQAQLSQIEADRVAVLNTLAAEHQRSIDDVLSAAHQAAYPLSELEAAQQRVNAQYDGWIAQLKALGAAQEYVIQVEADRQVALAALTQSIVSTTDSLSASVSTALSEAIASAGQQLTEAYNAQRQQISNDAAAQVAEVNKQLAQLATAASSQRTAISEWSGIAGLARSAGSDMLPESFSVALAKMDGYIQSAWRGSLPDSDAVSASLSSLRGLTTDTYATGSDYRRDQALAAAKTQALADAAEGQLSVAEQQLKSLEAQEESLREQITAIEAARDAQLAALELQYELGQDQLAKLKGLDKTTLSMDATLARIDELTATANQARDLMSQAQALQSQAQIAAQQGTTYAVSAVHSAITSMNSSLQSILFKLSEKDKGDAPGFAAGGMHSGGWRIVGEDGPELEATGPAMIYNATQTATILRGGSGGQEVAAELRQLRAENRAQAESIVRLNARLVRIFERWNYDGLPEQRSEVA